MRATISHRGRTDPAHLAGHRYSPEYTAASRAVLPQATNQCRRLPPRLRRPRLPSVPPSPAVPAPTPPPCRATPDRHMPVLPSFSSSSKSKPSRASSAPRLNPPPPLHQNQIDAAHTSYTHAASSSDSPHRRPWSTWTGIENPATHHCRRCPRSTSTAMVHLQTSPANLGGGYCYGCKNNGSPCMQHPNYTSAYIGGHLDRLSPFNLQCTGSHYGYDDGDDDDEDDVVDYDYDDDDDDNIVEKTRGRLGTWIDHILAEL